MKYQIIHTALNEDVYFGYTNLADLNTFDHHCKLAKGEAGPFNISFIPFDKKYIEANYQFDAKEDAFYQDIKKDSSVLYLFVGNPKKINFITHEQWFDLERTKEITDKANIKRMKELAGIK